MHKKQISIIALILVIVVLCVGMVATSTILPLDEEGNVVREDQNGSDEDYLGSHWDAITEEIAENAVELDTLMNSADDLSTVKDQYEYNGEFLVTGTLEVKSVDTESKAGYIEAAPAGYTGPYTIQIQIGTVFKGTALRDSLSSISFSDFDNQMEWSDISTQMLNKIYEEQISALDLANLEGKNIRVIGAFELSGDTISIQPFELKAE